MIEVSEQFFYCSMPFRFDNYIGCQFNCQYCFAKGQELLGHKHKVKSELRISNISEDMADLVKGISGSPTKTLARECLGKRLPIHWGGMAEPFMPVDREFRSTEKFMQVFNEHKYPVVISTKSPLCLEEPYFSLLKQGNYIVQVSLISDDAEFIRMVDYQAPNAKSRMRMIGKLSDAGIKVVGRIQPVIPGTVVEDNLGEFILKLAKLGVYHVSVEGLKMNPSSPIGKLVPGIWRHFSQLNGFERCMTPSRKWAYIKLAKEACKQANISLGVADNELRDQGTSMNCCIGDVPGWRCWDAQTGTAIEIAKRKGTVTFDEVLEKAWLPNSLYHLQDYEWTKDADGIRRSQTVENCLRRAWFFFDRMKGPEHIACLKHIGNHVYAYRDPVPMLDEQVYRDLPILCNAPILEERGLAITELPIAEVPLVEENGQLSLI